jgi:hypothetical protein
VLIHVPYDPVEEIITTAHRVAARAVVHFELHGPAPDFDFHGYPRDYGAVYSLLRLAADRDEVFPENDFRSAGVAPFHPALLVARTRA